MNSKRARFLRAIAKEIALRAGVPYRGIYRRLKKHWLRKRTLEGFRPW